MRFHVKLIRSLFIVLYLYISATSCSSEDTLMELFEKEAPEYITVHYRSGNFTNSGYEEYAVFFKDPKEAEMLKKEPDHGKSIEDVMVFTIKKNRIKNIYDLKSWTGEYYEEQLEIIENEKLDFGEWDGFCYVDDFNENGLDELMYFILGGIGFYVEIYEYKDGSFETVLAGPEKSPLSQIETEVIGDKKIIRLYNYGGKDIPVGHRGWYNYCWNPEKGSYEIIEEGTEKW